MLKAKGAGVGEEVFKDGAREGERVGERVDIFGVCLKLIERLKGGGGGWREGSRGCYIEQYKVGTCPKIRKNKRI